jgi:hypothetical protein
LVTNQTSETLELFDPTTFQTQISYAEDSLVQLSALLESVLDSRQKILAVLSFLKSVGFSETNEYLMFSLKTSKDSSITTMEEPLLSSSQVLMNWGTTFNGKLLTAKISESRNIGKGYSLSDILETDPDPKYFLSDSAFQKMFSKKKKERKEKFEEKNPNQNELFSCPS